MTAKPYYQDEPRLCECGCGAEVRRRFVSGHNTRGMERTPEWLARQSASLAVSSNLIGAYRVV